MHIYVEGDELRDTSVGLRKMVLLIYLFLNLFNWKTSLEVGQGLKFQDLTYHGVSTL